MAAPFFLVCEVTHSLTANLCGYFSLFPFFPLVFLLLLSPLFFSNTDSLATYCQARPRPHTHTNKNPSPVFIKTGNHRSKSLSSIQQVETCAMVHPYHRASRWKVVVSQGEGEFRGRILDSSGQFCRDSCSQIRWPRRPRPWWNKWLLCRWAKPEGGTLEVLSLFWEGTLFSFCSKTIFTASLCKLCFVFFCTSFRGPVKSLRPWLLLAFPSHFVVFAVLSHVHALLFFLNHRTF